MVGAGGGCQCWVPVVGAVVGTSSGCWWWVPVVDVGVGSGVGASVQQNKTDKTKTKQK